MQLRRVVVHAKGAGVEELVLAVATAQEPNAEHAGAAGREQVPDRIANDVAVLRLDAEGGLTKRRQ